MSRPTPQPAGLTSRDASPTSRSRRLLALLAGAASVAAIVLLHTVAWWLHLLLIPIGIYLMVLVLLSLRERRSLTETERTQRRYDRVAPLYDLLELMMEIRARRWRRDLWSRVTGSRILELGVGTGKNLRYHPGATAHSEGAVPIEPEITAIDLSEGMLARARRRARRLGSKVRLEQADVQSLPYPDGHFDTVIATFLFCSVPDPVAGLREARRVLEAGGQLLLLEHVLSEKPVLRPLMRWLDPLPANLYGAHIDRETVASVRAAGLADVRDTNLSLDVVKRIEALAPADGRTADSPSESERGQPPESPELLYERQSSP